MSKVKVIKKPVVLTARQRITVNRICDNHGSVPVRLIQVVDLESEDKQVHVELLQVSDKQRKEAASKLAEYPPNHTALIDSEGNVIKSGTFVEIEDEDEADS